jgi:Lon-like protease
MNGLWKNEVNELKRKQYLFGVLVFLFVIFLSFYPLNYYIMQPGHAYDANEFITVKNGDEDEGKFHFMTVSIGKATPVTYIVAKLSKYKEILKREEVRQEGESDEEYRIRQLKLMSDSQFNALYVAFTRANLPYTITHKGVYIVNIVEGSAADGILKPGDVVTALDGKPVVRRDDLLNGLQSKGQGDQVQLEVKRDDIVLTKQLTLQEIPNEKGRIGLGISYSESKLIKTNPEVDVDTEDIGGPSAGLMFTLEILNQLLDEDITKGYEIAGTGEMLEDGTVGRIGGIEKKVVAAHKAEMAIFFAPDDEITEEMRKKNPSIRSNYEAAVETAKELGTTMKIVPVKTIDDALAYLANLEEK